ncbi:MAG: BrnT family toxin [Ruminococcus sp.]|nr:BrnT family toxin [Ruminococcus sp.]
MLFEWDEEKNIENIRKHGFGFETAIHVFADKNRIEYYDEYHSNDEDRYITIGMADNVLVVIMVVYTEREDRIRLISARKATKREKEKYYGNSY